MNKNEYLRRIGVAPNLSESSDIETLKTLQRAHLKTIPFETLSVTGSPNAEDHDPSVPLDINEIYTKIITEGRGGFCYELNGLFGWLLSVCGFDVKRVAGRVHSEIDGTLGPPAGHLSLIVQLDAPYLVEVGFGAEVIRDPLSLDETVLRYPDGKWRARPSDRSDADYIIERSKPDSNGWKDRFIIDTSPRDMSYFRAGCEYHLYAPEARFNENPVVTIATDRGYKRLSPEEFAVITGSSVTKQTISNEEWYRLLETEFNLSYPGK